MTTPLEPTPAQQPPVDPEQQAGNNPETTPPVTPPETPPQTPPAGQTPPELDWKKRYDGAVLSLQQLTAEKRTLEASIQEKTSQVEQLQATLSSKDIEKTVAVGERDKNLEAALKQNQDLQAELASLKAFKLKIEVAKELNAPELVQIADRIPDLTDKEVLTNVMQDFLGFRQSGIRERETALLSGITPPTPPIQNTPSKPTTAEGWQTYVNEFAIGSKERMAAFDEWFDWQQEQAKA